MKLYQIHTGFYDKKDVSKGFYEGHTNLFVCARNERDAQKQIRENKDFKKFKMHVDGIQEISIVDKYKVKLEKI